MMKVISLVRTWPRRHSQIKNKCSAKEAIDRSTSRRLLAAISFEFGVEAYEIVHQHVNSRIFCQIIPKITKQKNNPVLFGNNVQYHLSKETTGYLKQANIKFIRNVPHSPELNPIERYFSMVKHYYKQIRLQDLLLNKHTSTDALIQQAK